MIGRLKPRGIHVLALLIGFGGVMDLQNFFWFFIDPANLLFSSIEVHKRFNFYVSLPVGMLSLLVGYAFIKGLGWGRFLGAVSSMLGILITVINLPVSRIFSLIIVLITLINAVTMRARGVKL